MKSSDRLCCPISRVIPDDDLSGGYSPERWWKIPGDERDRLLRPMANRICEAPCHSGEVAIQPRVTPANGLHELHNPPVRQL